MTMPKGMTPDEQREWKREEHRKRVERRKAQRARKWDEIPEGGVSVEQMPASRGNLRHGLYRRMLGDEEMPWAEQLHREYAEEHGLTLKSDLDALWVAVVCFVKATRPEPEDREGDKNVKDFTGYNLRLFGEWMDRLGISRKVRKEDARGADMMAAINRLFGPGARDAIDVTPAREALGDGEE